MENDWENYPNNRLIKKFSEFVVIKPANEHDVIPLACPVCDMLMKTSDDVTHYRACECCHFCGLRWADSDRERWNSGWRPSQEEIKIAMKDRNLALSINIDALLDFSDT